MVMKMSILSQRAAENTQRQRAGGKIRPGIKVLTNKAKENKKAVEIYNKGVAARMKFTKIEQLIKEATGIANSMYPKNTPYFTASADDFGMPEVANLIVEQYGEVRGADPEKRLYRFPVVFHSDELGEVYPNQFRRFGGQPSYESVYAESGMRLCQYLPEVTPQMLADQNARRIKRAPRRTMVTRGECDPNICPEYLMGECKFRGTLHFYIPGIPSTGLMVMETTSEYAAEAIYVDLERIHKAFGGIPRANPKKPGQPIFYITKVEEARTYFENGVKKTGKQWVPKLQADIDLGSLLQNSEAVQIGLAASAPVGWLAAPKGMPEAAVLPAPAKVAQEVAESVSADGVIDDSVEAGTQQGQTVAGAMTVAEELREQLLVQLAEAGVEENVGADYFDMKLGSDWQEDEAKIQKCIDHLANMQSQGTVGIANKMAISIKRQNLTALLEKAGVDLSVAGTYFELKFGADWKNNAATIQECIGLFETMQSKKMVGIGSIMAIPVKCRELNIAEEDFKKFAVIRYGQGYFKSAQTLAKVVEDLNELGANGPEGAQSFIQATIANAEAQPA